MSELLDKLHDNATLIAAIHGFSYLLGSFLGIYDRHKHGRERTLREVGAGLLAIGRRLINGRR